MKDHTPESILNAVDFMLRGFTFPHEIDRDDVKAAREKLERLRNIEEAAKAVSDAQPLMGDEDEHLLRSLRVAIGEEKQS